MTKKITITIIASLILIFATTAFAQIHVATFDTLTVPNIGYWDGSNTPNKSNGFVDGNCYFNNYYSSSKNGNYWMSGFAYSNVLDTITKNYLNLFGCAAGKGYNGSANYAMAQDAATVRMNSNNPSSPEYISGFYVTNSYYAYASMKFGDYLESAFGDTSGNRPDFFKLTVRGYLNGILTNDSVEFYLADYRDTNNAKDYIVKDWTWVDCKKLGAVNSVLFVLSSSRVGKYGINTPLFFAIDNFTVSDSSTFVSVNEQKKSIVHIFPNPTKNQLTIKQENNSQSNATIYTLNGENIYQTSLNKTAETIDLSGIPGGMYFIEVRNNETIFREKFIKE